LIVSTTGAAIKLPAPGATSAMPARTSSALTSGRAPSWMKAASQRAGTAESARASALLTGRTAAHDDASEARRVLGRERGHALDVLGFGRDDEIVEFGHRAERRERPRDHRPPGNSISCFGCPKRSPRPAATRLSRQISRRARPAVVWV
jgi:hypothetical protein